MKIKTIIIEPEDGIVKIKDCYYTKKNFEAKIKDLTAKLLNGEIETFRAFKINSDAEKYYAIIAEKNLEKI